MNMDTKIINEVMENREETIAESWLRKPDFPPEKNKPLCPGSPLL
jgi:hypothetical protein